MLNNTFDIVMVLILVVALAAVTALSYLGYSNVCHRVGADMVTCNDTKLVYKLEEIK